jgi:hypothetical protein
MYPQPLTPEDALMHLQPITPEETLSNASTALNTGRGVKGCRPEEAALGCTNASSGLSE